MRVEIQGKSSKGLISCRNRFFDCFRSSQHEGVFCQVLDLSGGIIIGLGDDASFL
jgi:hypothetical protein